MTVPKKPSKEYLAKVLAEKQAKQFNNELTEILNKSLERDPELKKLFFPPHKSKRRTEAKRKPKPTSPEQQPTLFDMRAEYQ